MMIAALFVGCALMIGFILGVTAVIFVRKV